MYVYHVHILRMWSLGVYIYMCIHVIYIYIRIYIYVLVGGFNPSEKYEFVSWDFYSQYSQYMESHKTHVPNHQPVYIYYIALYEHRVHLRSTG